MANNIPALETEVFNLFVATTNLDAATKQKVRDRVVAQIPTAFQQWLSVNSLSDTPATRGQFVAHAMITGFIGDIFKNQSIAAQAATIVPEVLQ